jgi:hypothetical protein
LVEDFAVGARRSAEDAGALEEPEGSVDGGLAGSGADFSRGVDEFLGGEGAGGGEGGVEDGGAFGGVLEAFAAEGASEDGAERWRDADGRELVGGCARRPWAHAVF